MDWFVKRLFQKMLYGGIGVVLGAVYCLIKGIPSYGIPLLIFGLICVAGGLIYKMTHKDR